MESSCRVFPWRLTSGGGIFYHRLLFKNNMILFSPLFSGNFCGGQGCDGEGQSRDKGDPLVPPTREIPALYELSLCSQVIPGNFLKSVLTNRNTPFQK